MKDFSLCSMITSMSDIICISNRSLCSEDFISRMKKIAEAHPKAAVLREKDLTDLLKSLSLYLKAPVHRLYSIISMRPHCLLVPAGYTFRCISCGICLRRQEAGLL